MLLQMAHYQHSQQRNDTKIYRKNIISQYTVHEDLYEYMYNEVNEV